jgi:hypothetical protein
MLSTVVPAVEVAELEQATSKGTPSRKATNVRRVVGIWQYPYLGGIGQINDYFVFDFLISVYPRPAFTHISKPAKMPSTRAFITFLSHKIGLIFPVHP